MNEIERTSNRWRRFREVAEQEAAEAKARAERALSEVDDLDDPELGAALVWRVREAAEEFIRHRAIVDRVLPEIERARQRALVRPALLPRPPRR